MHILYVSALSSESFINDIYNKTKSNPGFAVQKFSRSLVKGMVKCGANCVALSVPPISRDFSKSFCFFHNNEKESDIQYSYIPFINIPLLKHVSVFIYAFIYLLMWGRKHPKEKVIICDVLCVSLSLAVLLASRINRLKTVAVVTDIYDQMVGGKTNRLSRLLKSVAGALNRKYVQSFSMYVLLTEAMNDVVNPHGRPYLIIEGLCDAESQYEQASLTKSFPRVILYAGGLEERYGLKMLVDAFKSIDSKTIELHIYGSGSYENQLKNECICDPRIRYWGVKPNYEVVEAELKATLLVNPRFTTEEFTKYSFPSKNMEYMLSGTPLLTTKLPGMPKEYDDYVFLFNEETIEGYAQRLIELSNLSEQELLFFGHQARRFVLKYKNNISQAGRILELIKSYIYNE